MAMCESEGKCMWFYRRKMEDEMGSELRDLE